MLAPLRTCAPTVGSDITGGADFLEAASAPLGVDSIITNPPYKLAVEFIDRALCLMESRGGMVAMLLRTDFDHARTRQYLFASCDAFTAKVVLTRRIRWIADSTGSPSYNHAWFIWDWQHRGAPTIAYYHEQVDGSVRSTSRRIAANFASKGWRERWHAVFVSAAN